MSRRAVTTIVGIGAAGAGYYLYSAGGSPKVAEKQFEKDVNKLTNNKSGEAQRATEEYATRAGKTLDSAYARASDATQNFDKTVQQKFSSAEAKYEQEKAAAQNKFEELRKDADKKIDSFDKTVEQKAKEAKSGLSSWWSSPK